ncbi:MAG: AAA family ATPase [Lachnospiraceae bacterium]|nr:AAA family ATPase [Lachnospiraceae bacterium]
MENYDIETLKAHLPEYLATITQHRKGKQYNCPFCGSGTGKNGTPALSTYEDNTKWKCQSCGAGGDIINLFYMVNRLEDTPENFKYAVKTLSEIFHTGSISSEPSQSYRPTGKVGSRTHVYYNADGSIFGKKVITTLTNGKKSPCWYLYDHEKKTYITGLHEQKAPLYNANVLHNMDEGTVFITEGEKDADTLSRLDDIPATTIPNGAGFSQWIDLYNDGLQGKDIIILTDNDDVGRKYGIKVAQNTLNIAKSVKIIPATAIWDKCPEKGDISDIVQSLGEDKATQLLADAIHKTPFCTSELLQTIEKNATSTLNQPKIVYHTVKLSEVESEKQEFLWNPYIPMGEITVMFAAGGTGKSYATIGITADVTAGRTLPKYGEKPTTTTPAKVLIISAEDTASTIKNRMQEIGGNPDNCILLKTPKNLLELHEDSFLLPQDKDDIAHIEAFANLLKEIKPKLVIIDPWSVYIGNDKNMNKSNDMRGITTVLTTLAKEYHCAILIVAHVNKMPQMENANNAVSGSTALIDAARSALCVRSFGADSDRRVIIQTKANYSHKGKAVCYRIIDQGEGKTARFEWAGFCDLTEDDLTNAARTGKSLSDIENDNFDEKENKEIAIKIIKNLAVYGQSVCISYVRFRQEIVNDCGEDFLPPKPTKFMGSLVSDLRVCGISLEFKKAVRGILPNGERDTISRIGFVIHCMTNGNLMASAMPN